MTALAKVVVVGGGIMGACAAWYLARAGTSVTIILKERSPLSEATASSFGWVGTGARLPSDNPPAFALHLEAVREFARLERDLGRLPVAVRGALIWWETEDATVAFLQEQRAAGVRIEAISENEIQRREPQLVLRPPLAAWAPDDFAVEPAQLARQLIAAAHARGMRVLRGTAEAIEVEGKQVAGVRVAGQVIPADIVVLANGYGARSLTAPLGLELPISESPAVLFRFKAEGSRLRHLLCGAGLEVRPTLGGGLTAAADFPGEAKEQLCALATNTAFSIACSLGFTTPPTLLSATIGQRPMTHGGEPFCGFLSQVSGLYAMLAHPGVTFAPLLGSRATTELMSA